MKQGQVAPSDITASNICFKRHRFQVEPEGLPFMSLLGPATFNVKAGAEYRLPVKFDATGLTPGEYKGKVLIKCETCPKEKGCTQDRQILNVVMSVTEATLTNVPTPSSTVMPGPLMTDKPGYTCCEKSILIKEALFSLEGTIGGDDGFAVEQTNGETTLTVSFPFKLELTCERTKEQKDCRAFANVKIKESKWEKATSKDEFGNESGWKPVPKCEIKDEKISFNAVSKPCPDTAKSYEVDWKFTYTANFKITRTLRNTRLLLEMSVPVGLDERGKHKEVVAQTLAVSLTEIDVDKGTARLNVGFVQ